MKLRINSSSGDTIVEVLFALAILALVLTSSYRFANQSLLAGQRAQERTEAVKIAESQLEALKYSAAQPGTTVFTPNVNFCIDTNSAAKTAYPNNIAGQPPTLESDDFTKYNAARCKFGTDRRYNVGIWYQKNPSGLPSDQDYFTVTIRWDRIGGGRDQVELIYKAHPDS